MEDKGSTTKNQESTYDWIIPLLLGLGLITFIAAYFVLSPKKIQGQPSMKVMISGDLPVSIAELSKFVKVVPETDEEKSDGAKDTIVLTPSNPRDVRFIAKDDLIELRNPKQFPLSAPILLGKQVEVSALYSKDLVDKIATLEIPGSIDSLTVPKKNWSIDCSSPECRGLDEDATLKFRSVKVEASVQRPVGIQPIRQRSMVLLNRWVTAGEDVQIEIPIPDLNQKNSKLAVGFWSVVSNQQMENGAFRADITGIEPKQTGTGIYIVKAHVPRLGQILGEDNHWFSPFPEPVKLTVSLDTGDGQIVTETFNLKYSRRVGGVLVGAYFVCFILWIIMVCTRNSNPFEKKGATGDEEGAAGDKKDDSKKQDTRFQKWEETYKSNTLKRFFLSPLDISLTPFGTFSISVTQAIFWTFIVAFSVVYVFILKSSFITITEQILLLLGISGGTALAARINSSSRDMIPKEIKIDFKEGDIPRLKDLISIRNRPNLFKFQMLVFTLITGAIVLAKLINAGNFPEIPGTLITLMGLSNTLYLGNEVAVEPVQGLRDLIKKYKAEEDPDEKKKIEKEIQDLVLERI